MSPKKFSILVLLIIILASISPTCLARSSSYYDIVNAISDGKNFYELLHVTPDSSPSDIKKQFRKLSLLHHPDKNKTSESVSIYRELSFAQQVLIDPETKKEYDDLLRFGLSTTHQYYARYAYKYGAPNVDTEYVLLGLVLFISVCQYLYKWHRHYLITENAKKTLRYRNALKQAQLMSKQDKETPELLIIGAEQPKIQDIFLIQLFLLPWMIIKFCIWLVKWSSGKRETEEEREERTRMKYGMTKEEWEESKTKAARKDDRGMSAREKRVRRFLKKYH